MTHVKYRIVRHDEGWAYKAGDVFSEPFRTHAAALAAAQSLGVARSPDKKCEDCSAQD